MQVTEFITKEQHQRYEKLVPEFCERPPIKAIPFDKGKTYKFIMFDTETTTTGIEAEICQLAAIDEDGQHEFTCYIMPKRNVTKYATDVNKLEILEIDGKKTLCHQGIPVKSLTKSEAYFVR